VGVQNTQRRNLRGGMKGVACYQLVPEEICHLKIRSRYVLQEIKVGLRNWSSMSKY
jgi:hypothetical protein